MELKDDRLERIMDLLLNYTRGDYSARIEISDKGDQIDAVILGLNTLGEELSAKK